MFLSGLALGMHSASAQEAAPAPSGEMEKIVVTGSRIRVATVTEGSSPITVVGAADIKSDGVKNVENLMNNLPQVFADQGGAISNGSTGTATVNLRNLGADRTLVLVNGRRLPQGSPLSTAADLNQIPAGLIKRVEVLSGGAGAVYGSDAVAGVINFIMNDKFEGVQIDVNVSGYNHQQDNDVVSAAVRKRNFALPGDKSFDAKSKDVSLLVGGNFADGKGNATLYAGYKQDDPLLQSQRDFTSCALGSSAAGFACLGSNTSFPGRFITDNGSRTVADANGNTRAYVVATDAYNYGPINYLQRPSDRYVFNATANYEINDKVQVYSSIGFHNDRTVAQIAPSGLFGLDMSGANAVHFENPLLSADWKRQLGLVAPGGTADALIFRRNVEGGGRQADITNTSYRSQIGFKGDIGPWSYDVFAQNARVSYTEVYKNEFSKTRAFRAMDVVLDGSGQPACRSVVNGTDPNCVPYNIWSLGKVTPEALKYLQTPGLRSGATTQEIQGGNISADLGEYGWKLPTSEQGIGLSVGLERRREELELETDTAFSSNDLFGQGGPSFGVAGQYTVKEIFGEVRVPLMEKRPFVDLLSMNASYRYSDYSTGKTTDSYGVGVEWAPVRQAKLRASYQRAARAANIVELFTPAGVGLYDNDEDPCAGTSPTASLAQCARTGVTAAQYGKIIDNPSGQYNQLTGGNVNLSPEEADSFTLGLVLEPIKNLSITLDAFSIDVKDVIANVPATTTLAKCLETGEAAFCSLIHRDNIGTLWAKDTAFIEANNLNLATRKTTGLDLGASYGYKVGGLGNFGFSILGTYLRSYETQDLPGEDAYDCKGFYGPTCGTPLPEWRHKARVTWTSPWNFETAFTWRHIDSVDLETTSKHPKLTGNAFPVDRTLGARDYLDLSASYSLTKNLSLSGGINNLLDKDPPVSAQVGSGFGNGNTYPQVYDANGRKVFVGLTAKF
ncbi:TonB-dependent receptor [Massilia cavernae]|uniref:TonB-dependent receptor n=2 Tax=Massilia cavernae TaxID=2320864 RepID=A0A418XEA7_9BURK|nr:TonB-dependent receptor [Massilia cavernae]